MAAVSLEVAALFAVEDQATPTLLRISELVDQITESARTAAAALADLGKLGADSLLQLGEQIGILDADLRGIGEAAGASAAEMDTAANTSVAALRRIQDEAFAARDAVASVGKVGAAEEEGALVGGALAARRGGEGHGASILSLFPKELVAPFAIYEGMRQSGSEQDSLAAAVIALGKDPRTEQGRALSDRLQVIAHEAANATTYTEREVAGGEAVLARVLGLPPEQFMGIFEPAAKAAEATERLKLGHYVDTLAGIGELMHLGGVYDAGSVERYANLLGAVTENVPHETMDQEARAMSYAVPMARTVGISPERTIEDVGFLQRSGLRGTVGATTYRQFLLGLLPPGSPLESQLMYGDPTKSEFIKGLRLEPGELQEQRHRHKDPERIRNMKELGLLDTNGKPLYLNSQGETDPDKAQAIIDRFMDQHPGFDTGKLMKPIFGARGEQAPELFHLGREQREAFHKRLAETPSLAQQQTMLASTPAGQAEQFVARLGDILNKLSEGPLKDITPVMSKLVTAEEGILRFLNSHKTAADSLGVGFLAGGAALAVGLTSRVSAWIKGIFTAGAVTEAAEAGAAAGVRAGLGALLGSAFGSAAVVGAAVAAITYAFKRWSESNQTAPPTTGLQHPDQLPTIGSAAQPDRGLPRILPNHLLPGAMPPPPPGSAGPPPGVLTPLPGPGTSPAGAAPNVHKESFVVAPGGGSTNVTVNVSLPANASKRDVMDHIARGLDRALAHSSGVGGGSFASPYTSGIDV